MFLINVFSFVVVVVVVVVVVLLGAGFSFFSTVFCFLGYCSDRGVNRSRFTQLMGAIWIGIGSGKSGRCFFASKKNRKDIGKTSVKRCPDFAW